MMIDVLASLDLERVEKLLVPTIIRMNVDGDGTERNEHFTSLLKMEESAQLSHTSSLTSMELGTLKEDSDSPTMDGDIT